MVKSKRNYIVAILVIAVLTLSMVVSAVAILTNKNYNATTDIPTPTAMANIDIKDENGKVDAPITSGGTPIATVAELKSFLKGSELNGYLTNNISGFYWDKLANDRQGASTIQFAKGRTLDGNGYTVTVGLDNTVTDEFPMITTASAVELKWTDCVKGSEGMSSTAFASSLFIAVNQGTVKNLNMDVMLTKYQKLEWVPSGGRNDYGNTGDRSANSQALFFGFMTGVNFGYISNSTVNFKESSQEFKLSNANTSSSHQWAKEERNDLEFGGFAGVNSGEISYVTANIDKQVAIESISSNQNSFWPGINAGNSSARAIYGGIVGRMQSDPTAEPNQVDITTALLSNSIISGKGNAFIYSRRNGSGGVLYNHVGAAVGSNSPYSGTVVNPTRGQSYGIIDGIISSYTGNLKKEGVSEWSSAGSTSGQVPSPTSRAIVDCGKISNVMFADAYDGHIDNCGCVGGEHIATRANGIKAVYGEGNLTMSFSRTDTSSAALIFELTPKAGASGMVDDNVIYAVTKHDRAVKDGANITNGTAVALFNYDSEGYYSKFSDTLVQTSKHAIIEVAEPRSATDINSYILELEFGRQVKAMYETSTLGKYMSHDDKLGREIATFPYDGNEKGTAKIVSLQDGDGQDTFEEEVRFRQFKSKYRSENQAVEEAVDYTMDLVYPGVYTEIYIQSTISGHHSYLDSKLRIVAPLEKDSSGVVKSQEFKITPVHIVAQNDTYNVDIGTGGEDNDDIDTNKLFANTYASFDFDFSVFAFNQSGNRHELKKSISGTGDNVIITYPYDRIEYSNDGYIFYTALTYSQLEDGEKFVVNKSTHPTNGRNYYFRAIKELRDGNGVLKFETAITLDSKNYAVRIDGEAPKISAKVVGGDNDGSDFLDWSGRNEWKTSEFTLEFNIVEATADNLSFNRKLQGTADSTGESVTLSGNKVTTTFADDKVYVYYAFDKYGNRSKDYQVSAKIDTVVPVFNFVGALKDFGSGGNLTIDGTTVVAETVINETVVADRTINLSINFTQLGASGAISYYKLNNSEWIKMSGNTISLDKVADSAYYNADGTVNETIFDNIVIKTVSGAGLETVSNVTYKAQVKKNIILVDKDTVTTSDGFFVTKGIRREHLTKTYTSNTALSKGLIEILNNAINDELQAKYGEVREPSKRIYVEGHYASADVGDDIPIILKVIDPLDVYTINANLMELQGFIAPALINVTVNSATREFGRNNPKFTYSVSGLLGSDTIDLSGFISAPESVTLETPVNSAGIKLNVPKKGYLAGNYRIGTVDSSNAKLYIVAQQLTEVYYDDSYLNFAYNGGEHFIYGTYRLPNGNVANLNAKYYDSNNEVLDGGPIEIGKYKAIFTIGDTNYILDPTRATINFEVHKGYVDINVPSAQLNLKFDGKERKIEPELSNGSTPKILFYNSARIMIHDGTDGYYPMNAGTYYVRVEYNNDTDEESKIGKYYNNIVELTMTISKVAMAESGMSWTNVKKRYDGILSRAIVSNIPTGTTIPEGLIEGDVEGSYILLERTDVGDVVKKFAFKNPNIIEQELEASIKIEKASFDDYNVKLESLKIVFDNEPHTIQVVNLPSGIDVSVKTITGTTAGLELDENNAVTRTEAGNYKLVVQVTNDNFTTKQLMGTLSIAKAKVTTAKAEPVNVRYDALGHYSIITGVPSDINMESKTSIQIRFGSESVMYEATPMNAERTIWQTPSKVSSGVHNFRAIINNGNYESATSIEGTFMITTAYYSDFGTVGENTSVVYDGTEKVLKISNVPEGTTYTDALGYVIPGTISVTDSGTYSIDVYLKNPNIAELYNHFTASLTISPKENSKVYAFNGTTVDYAPNTTVDVVFDINQLDPDFSVEFNALDGMTISGNTLTFTNAGTYDIVGFVVNRNYVPRKITAQVVINKILAPYSGEVSVNDQTVIYNGLPQAPTIGGLDQSYGANVNITYSGAIVVGKTPTNAGTYQADVVISHQNYINISKNITFTISPAVIDDLGFKIADASFVYDGNTHETYVLNGNGMQLSGFGIKLQYSGLAEGELPINAGSYVVSGILSKNNYQDLVIQNVGTLDIIKATPPELTTKNITAKYTGKAQKISISRADGIAMGEYTVQVLRNGAELADGIIDVGSYVCTLIVTQQNYTTVVLTTQVVISPKAVVITYANVESPVSEGKFVLTGTYKDVNGVDKTVIFDFPEGFVGAAGKYTVGVRIADPNYAPTEETATITFEIKGTNVGAIAGGAGGGAAVVCIGVGLFFVFKKKKISL